MANLVIFTTIFFKLCKKKDPRFLTNKPQNKFKNLKNSGRGKEKAGFLMLPIPHPSLFLDNKNVIVHLSHFQKSSSPFSLLLKM